MKKLHLFLLLGILFGIILSKSEVISWFRIQEMFMFQSFHMYGVIGSAVVTGMIFVNLAKRNQWKNNRQENMVFKTKEPGIKKFIFGGIIFGLGWSLVGACPGPMFVWVGRGEPVFIIVLLSALAGTFTYGLIKKHLPH
jgi:uncharacterized membrane protein YedE/YeeE